MRVKPLFLLSVLGLCAYPGLTSGLSTEATLTHLKEDYIPALEKELEQLQGGAIAIIAGGKVIYQKTFGTTVKDGEKVTPHTLFPLGSGSKPIMATTIAYLIREKKISLDTEVPTSLKLKQTPLLLRHVLSHTSGYRFSGNQGVEKSLSRAQIMHRLQGLKPETLPGAFYYYSNFIYSLAQETIEKSTGQPWLKSVEAFWEKIIPQGTAHCQVPEGLPLASPHMLDEQKKKVLMLSRIPKNYPKTVCSAGGFFASLSALSEFLKLQLGYSTFLNAEDLKPFHTPYAPALEPLKWELKWLPAPSQAVQPSYGLGWRIADLKDDPHHLSRFLFHGGYVNGINTFMGFSPHSKMGVIILVNQQSSAPMQFGIRFWREIQQLKAKHR